MLRRTVGGPVRSLLVLPGQETRVVAVGDGAGVIFRIPLEAKMMQFADSLAAGNQRRWRD